jgi:hypothetical protein
MSGRSEGAGPPSCVKQVCLSAGRSGQLSFSAAGRSKQLGFSAAGRSGRLGFPVAGRAVQLGWVFNTKQLGWSARLIICPVHQRFPLLLHCGVAPVTVDFD